MISSPLSSTTPLTAATPVPHSYCNRAMTLMKAVTLMRWARCLSTHAARAGNRLTKFFVPMKLPRSAPASSIGVCTVSFSVSCVCIRSTGALCLRSPSGRRPWGLPDERSASPHPADTIVLKPCASTTSAANTATTLGTADIQGRLRRDVRAVQQDTLTTLLHFLYLSRKYEKSSGFTLGGILFPN